MTQITERSDGAGGHLTVRRELRHKGLAVAIHAAGPSGHSRRWLSLNRIGHPSNHLQLSANPLPCGTFGRRIDQ